MNVSIISNRLHCRFICLALVMSLLPGLVLGDYTDPIDMDAVQSPVSEGALMLDITSTGDRLVAVGERGFIVYSDDAGQTWQQANVGTRAQLNAVVFVDEKLGWAVGEDAIIMHSQDGGQTWVRQFDDRDAEQKGPLLDVWFKDANTGFAVGVFNKIYRTSDRGVSWENWAEKVDNLDEWHLFSITATSPDSIYLSSEAGLIFRSTDGGESFEPIQSESEGSFHGILARQIDGADQLVLFGVGGKLISTSNGGQSWSQHDSGISTGLASGTWLNKDGGLLLVGTDGVIMHADSQLSRWTLYAQSHAMPLASVTVSNSKAIVVGLGGVYVSDVDTSQLRFRH